MKPCAAGMVQVDAFGRFETTFHVGIDLDPGGYKLAIATGSTSLGINLFEIYLEVQ
jgi:hypothetical protein